jgi:HKD family nuclease
MHLHNHFIAYHMQKDHNASHTEVACNTYQAIILRQLVKLLTLSDASHTEVAFNTYQAIILRQ